MLQTSFGCMQYCIVEVGTHYRFLKTNFRAQFTFLRSQKGFLATIDTTVCTLATLALHQECSKIALTFWLLAIRAMVACLFL